MNRVLLLAALMVGSCHTPSDSPEITAEIATRTAVAVLQSRRETPQPVRACCKKCVNGKVKSGDGLAWIPCPCPADCKCKYATGACRK